MLAFARILSKNILAAVGKELGRTMFGEDIAEGPAEDVAKVCGSGFCMESETIAVVLDPALNLNDLSDCKMEPTGFPCCK